MGFQDLIGKFLVGSIFIIALMSLIVVQQSDNNAPQQLQNNSIFNESFGGLLDVINDTTQEAEEKYSVFNSEVPQTSLGSIVLFGIVSVVKTFNNLIFELFVAIIKLPLIVFGLPASIYNLILVWLTIVVIIVAWLTFKFGG